MSDKVIITTMRELPEYCCDCPCYLDENNIFKQNIIRGRMFQMALILLRSRISRKSRWFSVELVANQDGFQSN